MLFAVLLDLDAGTQAVLRPLADGLAAIPGLQTMRAHHLTLAVYEDLPLDRFLPALARLAETLKPMDLRLANVGIFTGVGSVLFLGPVVTTELLALHDRLHRELAEFASHCLAHYLPGAWVPHVTLAMGVKSDALSKAIATSIAQWKPAQAGLEVLRLVEFFPVRTAYRRTLSSSP
jgi:2'-5' RNA ligase